MNIGVVGCGNISRAYLTTLTTLCAVRVVAVADRDEVRAEVTAAEHDVRAVSVDALLADSDVDLVLNLTTPESHADIALRAIAAGKSVYNEKPLAATTTQATEILAAGARAGVTVACAPDTVLGNGVQTARKAIDGLVGRPTAATATMATAGHERWHPDPDFYYAPGGGPLLDMGPYYITALVTLLGPVAEVMGSGSRIRHTRVIQSGPRAGEEVPVAVDTHVTGVLVHDSGVMSTLVMSFDMAATYASPIEVHGDLGSLVVPDPNTFVGEPLFRAAADDVWSTVPVSAGYLGSTRGYGIADIAATPDGRLPRASGALAYHVLDVVESLLRSAGEKRTVHVVSTCDRPAGVPLGPAPGGIDVPTAPVAG